MTGKQKQYELIEKVIANHLVAVWTPEDGPAKANYRVTVENLVDFIDQNFTWKRQGIERAHGKEELLDQPQQ